MMNYLKSGLMKISDWKLVRFLFATQAIFIITLVLDVPTARQVIGFLYLTFIPGFILLKVFGLEKSNMTETILFSVGLSISFLMFTGLLINELGPILSKPLSTELLAIIINIIIFIFTLSLKNKKDFDITFPRGFKIYLLAITYFPLVLLSVIGAMFVDAFQNNILLILVILAIPIIFLLSIFSPKFSPHYPLVLIAIALALLFHKTLISNYIHGNDINFEYYFCKLTKNISYWNPNLFTNRSWELPWQMYFIDKSISMLSITILPTIFSNILNIEETWILKIIYPLIYSFLSLSLYQMYQTQLEKKTAFLSSFFFMSNTVFLQLTSNAKQMIAELFFVLIFLVLLKKNMNPLSRWICLICFSFSLTVSHYSTSYIFLFLIFSTWLYGKIFTVKKMKINLTMALFFTILSFSWYMFVNVRGGAYNSLTNIFRWIFNNFYEEFFNPQSRDELVLRGVGMLSAPTFFHDIGQIIQYIIEFFILIGFITLIAKQKEKFDSDYVILTSFNMILLLICIVVPGFAGFLQISRFYNITLLFLSPLFILGGRTFFLNVLNLKKEKKKESHGLILVLIVLVTFFLFQAGFVYEITQDPSPTSFSLSKYRMGELPYISDHMGLIHENDVFGALWLSKYADLEHKQIYSDVVSKYKVLSSYGMINQNEIGVLSNNTVFETGSYFYLSRYSVMNGIVLYWTVKGIYYNITELPIFNSKMDLSNKIYANGACEIYKSTVSSSP